MMGILLDTCMEQTTKLAKGEYPESIFRKKQYLHSIIYINNTIGQSIVDKIV